MMTVTPPYAGGMCRMCGVGLLLVCRKRCELRICLRVMRWSLSRETSKAKDQDDENRKERAKGLKCFGLIGSVEGCGDENWQSKRHRWEGSDGELVLIG